MILDKDFLIKDKHGVSTLENYTAKLVSYEALDEIIDLMQRVYDSLPIKEVLFMDSYEDIYEDLTKGAKIIGVYGEDEQLIAFRYVSFPGDEEKNLGNDVGLPKEIFHKICQLETTVVDIPYRGNNLQSMTLGLMIPIIKEEGYNHMVCTISPYNYYSVNNIMKHGLKVKELRRKYASDESTNDGFWRYILHGIIEEEYNGEILDEINVDMTDIDLQRSLLKDGYIGFELDKEKEYLKYIKF
jgi:hypothetical protein